MTLWIKKNILFTMDIEREKLLNSDVFCISPWTHFNLTPDGEVHPCCISDYVYGSVHDNSLREIWNSDKIKKLRLNMLNGVQTPECSSCYNEEKTVIDGHKKDCLKSRRKIVNNEYKHHLDIVKKTNQDGSLDEFNLIQWDLRFTNRCNFKCRMCGPVCSSSWEKELNYPKKKEIDFEKINEELKDVYEYVEEVYFAGGEPLIADEHYEILSRLIEMGRKDVNIFYNTNFSTLTYKDKNILDYWKKLSNLFVYVSVDGMGKRGEVIRNGFKWDNFLENVSEFYNQIPNGKLNVTCTVQSLNAFHVTELHQHLYENKIIKNIDDFHINLLNTPDYYAIHTLPTIEKRKIVDKIKDYIYNYLKPNNSKKVLLDFVSLIKYIMLFETNYELIKKFVNQVKTLDLTRNENCRIIFPEFEESIWKHYY